MCNIMTIYGSTKQRSESLIRQLDSFMKWEIEFLALIPDLAALPCTGCLLFIISNDNPVAGITLVPIRFWEISTADMISIGRADRPQ